ncbi:MAG: NAD-dependent deacylase [Pseudomonadota bacterium]
MSATPALTRPPGAPDLRAMDRIVVLSGAGLSAESGLGTFRDVGGIWTKYDLEDVATPQGYARNPELVQSFYNARRRQALAAEPNAGHMALARLAKLHAGQVMLVTQNIDPLLARAGATSVVHMHGEIARSQCTACGTKADAHDDLTITTVCASCGAAGTVRPDVVWFGEMPYWMDEIYEALSTCDLFISIGTSGTVYPAAGFVEAATAAGAHTVELNLEPSAGTSLFDEHHAGPATQIVPAFVDLMLGSGGDA